MTLKRTAAAWAMAAAAGAMAAAGCGQTSARILESIDAATPPGSNVRLDVFAIRSVTTCAAGSACTARDSAQCFYVADSTGPSISFSTDGLRFLPPGDPLLANAAQTACFRLALSDADVSAIATLMNGMRAKVFQESGGDINLDVRLHEVPTLEAGFSRYYTGLFLEPATLGSVGLPLLNRETDMVYAITGFQDPDTGLQPKMDFCAGTNSIALGIIGASTYSWLAMSERCAQPGMFLSTFMIQFYFGLRDVTGIPNLYAMNYPACGAGDPDPTRWFPGFNDCTSDPDAPACGASSCPDFTAYYSHVLEKHWVKGTVFNGNYCADGHADYDEDAIDAGGVCELIRH